MSKLFSSNNPAEALSWYQRESRFIKAEQLHLVFKAVGKIVRSSKEVDVDSQAILK